MPALASKFALFCSPSALLLLVWFSCSPNNNTTSFLNYCKQSVCELSSAMYQVKCIQLGFAEYDKQL